MASELPVPLALKVSGRNVYVGHPKQLVDLLAAEVATPIIEITRTKGGMPLYKLKLRCKILFEGNLDVCFLLDYPNQSLTSEIVDGQILPDVVFQLPTDTRSTRAVDIQRAEFYGTHLETALNFWAQLMEQQVASVYPDKTPLQMDRLARDSVISMKPAVFGEQTFELSSFLKKCDQQKGIPYFKVSFGWIASKEDPRSDNHAWGFKFEISPYLQLPPSARVRKPVSAAEKKEQLDKKRKTMSESDEAKAEETVA